MQEVGCRQCGAPIPPVENRKGGMPKAFCSSACRVFWYKVQAKAKAQAAKGQEAQIERTTYAGSSCEAAKRFDEIMRTPSLRAAREACSIWPTRRITMEQRTREMQADRLRYDRRPI